MSVFVTGPNEPGLEHFSQWLDHQVRRAPDAKQGMLGAILGTSWGLTGGALGVLMGGFQITNGWAALGLLPGIVGTVAGLSWYFKERGDERKAFAELHSQTRGLLWRLQTARWRSQLRGTLGSAAVELLDEGARCWLRGRAAFSSPLWNATSAGTTHLEARDRAKQAMDSAMARLALLAGNGGYEENPTGPAHKLIADMKLMADEAQSLMEKMGDRALSDPVDSSKDLRAALSELKMLSTAEDELRELKERDS